MQRCSKKNVSRLNKLRSIAGAFLVISSLLSCSAPPEPLPEPKKSDQDYTDNSKGRKFLKTKLSELDTIRQTAEFKKFGFGIGGPYAGWVEDLKSEGENMELRMWEMQGVSFLALLATTYASNNGREDASTKQARDYVQEVIDTPQ